MVSTNQTLFNEHLKRWTEKNVRDGFPQFNHVGWVYFVARKNWPDLALPFYEAVAELKRSDFSEAATDKFLQAWRPICRKVREYHISWEGFHEKRVSAAKGK